MSRRRRLAMVNRGHPRLSVVKQCRLLQLSRSAVYYRPTPTNPLDLDLMAGMDRQYLKTPFYGSRRMTAWLRTQGHQVNRKRARRLMLIRDNYFCRPVASSENVTEIFAASNCRPQV